MITVLAFEGEYDLSLGERLRRDLELVRDEDALVFDLTGVTYCEASCIADIVALAQFRVQAGASRVTIVPSPTVKRIFDVVGLDEWYFLADSVDDVLPEDSAAANLRHAVRGYESLSFADAPPRVEHPSDQSDSVDEARRRFGGTA